MSKNIKHKNIYFDIIYILLLINMLFVIIGYALVTTFGDYILIYIKYFKLFFLAFSFFIIILKNGFNTDRIINNKKILFFLIILLFFSFFSNNMSLALYRASSFIFPLLYVMFSINHLLKYGVINVLFALILSLFMVYSIIPITFFFFSPTINIGILYGYHEGNFFVSNHYGWGSIIYLLSSITIIRFFKLNLFLKILIILTLPFVLYLLILSANRASILSILIAYILFLFKDKNITIIKKSFLTIFILILSIFILSKTSETIEFLKEKNKRQIETKMEGRYLVTDLMFNHFNENPYLWFTGIGMFNYDIIKESDIKMGGYHNSYWEVLFGTGFLGFMIFLSFMIFTPFKNFWKNTINYSLVFVPIAIIPFFESNLTAGQFLFFPWFSYIILHNSKEFKLYEKKHTIRINKRRF